MQRQRSLSASRDRNHPAREGAERRRESGGVTGRMQHDNADYSVTDSPGKAAMAEEATRSRLGRGLAALIGDVGAESSAERPRGQRRAPTTSLRPDARNPRRVFSETAR